MKAIQFFANKNYAEIGDPLDIGNRPAGTNLFKLKMGLVDIGNGQAVWASSLKKVYSGEKRYFKDWSGLVAGLQEILTPPAQFMVLQELMAQISPGNRCKTHTESTDIRRPRMVGC